MLNEFFKQELIVFWIDAYALVWSIISFFMNTDQWYQVNHDDGANRIESNFDSFGDLRLWLTHLIKY